MNSKFAYDRAFQQFLDTGLPTVIIPVITDEGRGLYHTSFDGNDCWKDMIDRSLSEAIAIGCCMRAYTDALTLHGAKAAYG